MTTLVTHNHIERQRDPYKEASRYAETISKPEYESNGEDWTIEARNESIREWLKFIRQRDKMKNEKEQENGTTGS